MIGKRLKSERHSQGLSLRCLAKKAGLSHSFISDIEHGRCSPSLEKLHVISAALGVKPESLLSPMVVSGEQKKPAAQKGGSNDL